MDSGYDGNTIGAEQTGLSTKLFLGVVHRHALLIALCCVLVAGAAYGYSKHQIAKYMATAAVTFNSNPLGQQIAGLSAINNASNLLAQQDNNRELVSIGDTAAKTASVLGHGLTDREVVEGLSISAQVETSTVDVTATSTSPTLAAAIANTYVNQFVKGQRSANRHLFLSALAVVNKQLARLSPAQRVGTDGLDLQERAHTLGLLAELGSYNNARVAQEALAPTSPSSPKTKRNTIFGVVLGLLLGFGIALLLERLDPRIRNPEELEGIYGLPMLGHIPESAALGQKGVPLPPVEAEAFSLIRAHLRFFNIDRDLRTVVIASPASGDGKTTTARHLAEAAARLGSRVLLLEADLRQPTLAKHLDVQSGPGLVGVLIGEITMGEATQSVELNPSPGEGATGRTLDVLPAGSVLPPNPGELLASPAMNTVLERAKTTYDFVIIDTPPLTAVSDAFPLLTKVDGVVVVGWIGRSRRDDAEKLRQVLASSGAPLLGVIANGSKSGAPRPYLTDVKSSPGAGSHNDASPSEQLVSSATD